jgi:hypothetical protein
MTRFVLGIAPILLAAGGAAAAADVSAWRVSEASGNVVVVEAGRSHEAAKGAVLASGAVVIARAGGRAVLVHDRDFVVVSPGARIRIAPPEQARTIYQIIAEFGTSLFRIEHQDRPHFGVRTPYLAAVVKGTVFSVTVGDKGASVQVTQGAVDVATLDGGAHELIRPGMIGSVEAHDRSRLNVDGDGRRVIRSSAAVAGAATASAVVPAPPADIDEDAPRPSAARVAAPVEEAPVSLADVTAGLVRGSSGAEIAMAAVASKPAIARDRRNGDSGGGAGAATGSGSNANGGNANNGNANGNNGNGNGNGNGNSHSDDGNDNGHSDDGKGGGHSDDGKGDTGPGGKHGSGSGDKGKGGKTGAPPASR